jgi:hypothetical protein
VVGTKEMLADGPATLLSVTGPIPRVYERVAYLACANFLRKAMKRGSRSFHMA